MKRYTTIHILGNCEVKEVKLPLYDKGAYIVDKSKFTPVSELAKSVVGQSIGATDLARYDFPDGKDTGIEVPIARRRPELAEMAVDVRNQQANVKAKLESAARLKKIQDATKGLYSESANES